MINQEHWWGKDMSESRSPFYNFLGIKEPINSLSALIGISLVLLSFNNNCNFLKICIIINLLCAILAHATYNYYAIKLDSITMVIPILYIFIYNSWYIELSIIYLLIKFMCLFVKWRQSMIFAAGLLILPFKKYNDVLNINTFLFGILVCILGAICRILDQNMINKWYYYLHAIWHVMMTIGLLFLIDSIKW